MATTSSSRSTFYFEVMKVLLHVAWADGEIEPREVEAIRRLMDQFRLNDEHRARIEYFLQNESDPRSAAPLELGEPDYALLKARKADMMVALQTFMLSDSALDRKEREILREIEALLEERG